MFVDRVRDQLHVVLAMSPIGDAFRTRLRMFPSLVNCCTIDWFQVPLSTSSSLSLSSVVSPSFFLPLPSSLPAVVLVYSLCLSFSNGSVLLLSPPLPLQSWPDDALTIVARRFLDDIEMDDTVKEGCVEMCKEFHQTTRKLSDRFLATLQRHNYVTPTSYLELISTYKTLLAKKRRYLTFCWVTWSSKSQFLTLKNE